MKSDVMAELSLLRVGGQTSQPFFVPLSEQSVRLSSPPTSLKGFPEEETTSWSCLKSLVEFVQVTFLFILHLFFNALSSFLARVSAL